MRKIRFRFIKENGKATSVTVRCSLQRNNASLISEALRHYQRLERENARDRITETSTKKVDKQLHHHRRHDQHVTEPAAAATTTVRQDIHPATHHYFDPIQLRRKQCSSTLIDEEIAIIPHANLHYQTATTTSTSSTSSSSSSGFRSHSHSSSYRTFSDLDLPIAHHLAERTNLVREIVHAECAYADDLKILVEVYLKQMRLHRDLFSDRHIRTLLGNVEEMLGHQQSFVQALKSSVDDLNAHESPIGQCFVRHTEDIRQCVDYCVHHPLASFEWTKMKHKIDYAHFFETCRLLTNGNERELDRLLLAPIERVCQYPLQLTELLQVTPVDHHDHDHVKDALDAIREMTLCINEQKRRSDHAALLCKWQCTVDGWQGDDLIDTSTQSLARSNAYLHAADGQKERVILFLFDRVLIICKRDRRHALIYLERAHLDSSEVEDLTDAAKDNDNVAHLLSFAWRLCDRTANRTYLFSHRTSLEKVQIMDALEYERACVEENLSKGSEVPILATWQTQQCLAHRSLPTTPMTKQNRSISAILQSSVSPSSHRSSVFTTASDDPSLSSQRKLSLPRFVRCSSRDSSIDDSFRSIKSRFRFWP